MCYRKYAASKKCIPWYNPALISTESVEISEWKALASASYRLTRTAWRLSISGCQCVTWLSLEHYSTATEHTSVSHIDTSNMTSITEVRSTSTCLFAGTWRPLVSVTTTLYYVAKLSFHHLVWYCALPLRHTSICSSGIILIS